MAYENVLLINRDDVMRITAISGNIDNDKLLPHVKTAQDIQLQPLLGTDLFDKCKELVSTGTLNDAGNEDYATLVNVHIAPVLVYYSMIDYLPFQLYQIENGGIYRHQADEAIVADKVEMDSLVGRFTNKAFFYAERLRSYLCNNSDDFAELSTNSDGDISPEDNNKFSGGWVL